MYSGLFVSTLGRFGTGGLNAADLRGRGTADRDGSDRDLGGSDMAIDGTREELKYRRQVIGHMVHTC